VKRSASQRKVNVGAGRLRIGDHWNAITIIALSQSNPLQAEEHASRNTLRSIQKAFREALLLLPEEEYDWFNIRAGDNGRLARRPPSTAGMPMTPVAAGEPGVSQSDASEPGQCDAAVPESAETAAESAAQREFFEFAGPLFSVRIAPATCVMGVGTTRSFRAVARDRERRLIESGLAFHWQIAEGTGSIDAPDQQIITYTAAPEPCLAKLQVAVTQNEITCTGEALVTVTDSLLPKKPSSSAERQGLPGYTYHKAPGELWRSRYDAQQNVIVVNNGHRDFVYASRNKTLKLRYLCRLFAKELVVKNFPGYSADQLLERMIELGLYTEEHLR